jgi:carbon storage regulator
MRYASPRNTAPCEHVPKNRFARRDEVIGSRGVAIGGILVTPIQEDDKEEIMLVLSRKLNEKIMIDGGIVVTVLKIDRNQIRLGIEAPAHVRVLREEIAESWRGARSNEAVAANA